MTDDRKVIGAIAEEAARKFLEAKGYIHRESNWRYRYGELDIVMMDGDELVFVEVKARRSEVAGLPEEGVSRKQAGILLRTGEMYAEITPDVEGLYWRIDLVGVELNWDLEIQEITHYENAIVIG